MNRTDTRNATTASVALTAGQAAFIQGAVSIVAATSGPGATNHISKVFGCRVSADGRSVTIILSALQAGALLAELRANRRLAVAFCRPSTDQTLQVKALDAQVVAIERDDYDTLAAHTDKLIAEITPMGFAESVVRPLFSCSPSDAVAVRFSPSAVFDQTPGPNAGARLSCQDESGQNESGAN
jgi:hypothetical protein